MIKNLKVRTKLVVGFFLVTIILVIAGMASVYFSQTLGNKGLELGRQLAPLGEAAREIKIHAVKGHLLFKEVVDGHSKDNIEKVWQLLDRSLWYTDAILNGNRDKKTVISATRDRRVKQKISELKKLLQEFIKIAKQTYEQLKHATAGSQADQEFDKLYDALQGKLENISGDLKQTVTRLSRSGSGLSNISAYVPLIDRIGETRYLLANGHLFFEEMLSGDTSVKFEAVLDDFNRAKNNIQRNTNRIGRASANAALKQFDGFIAATETRHNDFVKNLAADNKMEKAFNDTFAQFMNLADEAADTIRNSMVQGLKDVESSMYNIKIITIVLCLAGIIIAVLLSWVIGRSINTPLNQCVDFADEISRGNLAAKLHLDQKDELGQLVGSLNKMSSEIKRMILSIKTSASQVDHCTEEIVHGGSELSIRTNEQAASLTETSATIEQFTSILKLSGQNSEEANQTLEAFNAEIQTKKELIANVISTMNEISDSSKKIDNIVKVINDISFQTNLLALNAAVEAARAGEAGRGFAVVASEVRNLAQKTADSSKTIKQIVSQNVESTQKGMELIRKTSEFFETILQTLQQMSEQIQQIASGATEQTTGVEQINISINQLETIVNHNAGLVDRFEDAGRSLKTSSSELMNTVDHFKTEDEGKTKPIEKNPIEKPVKKTVKKAAVKPVPKPVPPQSPASRTEPKQNKEEDDFFAADESGFEEF